MNRPLSPLEHVVWLVDQAIQQNFVMVAHLAYEAGKFTNLETVLRETVDVLQEKYPPLKCKITGGESPAFGSEQIPKIPITRIDRKHSHHWVQIVEKEMIEPLPWAFGPLVRIHALLSKKKNKCDLLVTFCHIIADATSGVIFFQDLLTILGKRLKGVTVEKDAPHFPLPSPDHLLRNNLKFETESLEDIPPNEPAEFRGDKDVPPDKRITRVIQRILSPSVSQKLVDRCKQEKTSVHGALCAALLQVMVKMIRESHEEYRKKGPLRIGCLTPINMRDSFTQNVDACMGDFISQAIHYQPIDENASLWEEAQKVKESLQREIRAGNDIKGIQNAGECLESYQSSFHLARKLNQASAPVLVTNLGKLTLREQFDNLKLDSLHFTVGVNADSKNGFGMAVTTFRGRLAINFLYADPFISSQRANQIVKNIMKRLTDALQ
ncbi:MAG: phthiocerol/phthiodiolone dimycocerosyl transferase family protein [Candidatus Omnitrophota bacterium]